MNLWDSQRSYYCHYTQILKLTEPFTRRFPQEIDRLARNPRPVGRY